MSRPVRLQSPSQWSSLRVIDPRYAGAEDVVGVGDDLSPDTLRWAYRHGIFPWPVDNPPLLWFCPAERAVLNFVHLHIPRRLLRFQSQCSYTFTINTAFDRVVDACRRAPRPGQDGTWITPAIQSAYSLLHRLGDAHSVEAWNEQGALVGGLYGISVGGTFAGESMFHAAPNASKLALLHLIRHLQGRSLGWIDIQMMTPHMQVLGASLLPRDAFLDRLAVEQQRGLSLFD